MAALVEEMFYVSNEENNRFVPWHGLGTPVQTAPSSTEAIILAGLNWEVQPKDIFDVNGNKIPAYKANTRTSDDRVLGIVSDKYKIVQNSEAFSFTDSLLEEGVTYETAGSLKNGKTIWLLAKMPEERILGDKFDPYICFMNTHDGTGSIRVCMTNTRVVCNNTLNIALSTASRSWSTKHMGDMYSKLSEAQHTLGLAAEYNAALATEAEKLAEVKISDAKIEEIFDIMFPVKVEDSDRKKTNIITLKENLFTCCNASDLSQFKGTAWGLINAAADLADHNQPFRSTKNYQENNWGKIINGHPFVDSIYSAIKLAA